eukprot:228950_1
MSLAEGLRFCSDEKDTLKRKIKILHSTCNNQKRKELLATYWARICANPNKHERKLIIIEEYKQVINELNSEINKKKGRLLNMWGSLQTAHQNKINRNSRNNANTNVSRKRKASPISQSVPQPKKKKAKQIYKPKQNELHDEIAEINKTIVGLTDDLQKPFININAVRKSIATEKKKN